MKKTSAVLIISWFVNPKFVLGKLKIRTKLAMQDWLSLKKFPFGELGYDYEEGLRFYVPVEKAKDAASFIRKFHGENSVPWTASSKQSGTFYVVQARLGLRDSEYGGFVIGGPEYDKVVKQSMSLLLDAGFTPQGNDFILARCGASIMRRVHKIAKAAKLLS